MIRLHKHVIVIIYSLIEILVVNSLRKEKKK